MCGMLPNRKSIILISKLVHLRLLFFGMSQPYPQRIHQRLANYRRYIKYVLVKHWFIPSQLTLFSFWWDEFSPVRYIHDVMYGECLFFTHFSSTYLLVMFFFLLSLEHRSYNLCILTCSRENGKPLMIQLSVKCHPIGTREKTMREEKTNIWRANWSYVLEEYTLLNSRKFVS